MAIANAERAKPGRHRSEAADIAILEATLDLLSEHGYASLTMAAVIARSGVSSATLYRRWPTKQDLVAAALATLHAEIVDIDTGSLRTDVIAMVESSADAMSVRRDDLADDLAMELRRNPEFRVAVNEKFVLPRRRVMGAIIQRAQQRGELGAAIDAETAMAFISGPLHNRMYVQGKALTLAFQRTVATGALAAMVAIAPG